MTGPNEQAPQELGEETTFEGTAPPPRGGSVRRLADDEVDTGLDQSLDAGDEGSIPRDTDEQR